MSFQSELSALSDCSNYELLLSDRTEVSHKIFNSRHCLVHTCPFSRSEYEGQVTEVAPVWTAYTKQCSPAGLRLHNEVQNCEEALQNETIPQLLMVCLALVLPEVLTCSQDQKHSQECTSHVH